MNKEEQIQKIENILKEESKITLPFGEKRKITSERIYEKVIKEIELKLLVDNIQLGLNEETIKKFKSYSTNFNEKYLIITPNFTLSNKFTNIEALGLLRYNEKRLFIKMFEIDKQLEKENKKEIEQEKTMD